MLSAVTRKIIVRVLHQPLRDRVSCWYFSRCVLVGSSSNANVDFSSWKIPAVEMLSAVTRKIIVRVLHQPLRDRVSCWYFSRCVLVGSSSNANVDFSRWCISAYPAIARDQLLVSILRRLVKLERQRFEWSALYQLLVVQLLIRSAVGLLISCW
ncbi:hypothetical protein F511_22469 [Dorcoceras hygrometricum]|uniref:Uncharacterized protein n=1 Tax=Dorcoceras hygrometricum TaxID=472368 RepID=A0A2Z7BE61_9LAMI|nr:hypothetical protein F511_22469 [Dorcoceras hygrometricum]